MAKSSVAMAAAAALAAAPLQAAPPVSAEEALARQQASLRTSLDLGCDRTRSGEDIVVCGRQGPDPDRLPLPVPPEPGARVAGEPAAPAEALALSAEKCTTVGPNQQCSGGIPILGIALMIVRTVAKAALKED